MNTKEGLGVRAQSTDAKSQTSMYFFGLVLEIGSYCVAQAGLALATSASYGKRL